MHENDSNHFIYMKQYLQIIKATWYEYMTYRLSFVLWRVRMVVQLLVAYFLWLTITSEAATVFGYSQSNMLTYILLTLLVRPFVMGTRTHDVGSMILSGKLNYVLLAPMNWLKLLWSRDIADKLMNCLFAGFELLVLIFVLRPQIPYLSPVNVLLGGIAVVLGAVMFFYFSLIFSYLAFWTDDVWAPRFLSFVLAEFFTGMLFPLDILPGVLGLASKLLPFGYFIYFPVRLALGGLSQPTIIGGFALALVWTCGLWWIAHLLWKRGLREFGAVGI